MFRLGRLAGPWEGPFLAEAHLHASHLVSWCLKWLEAVWPLLYDGTEGGL